jgi:hypothetical protein
MLDTARHQHMVQEAKMKIVHMEGTWRLESTSVGLHPCEASFQKQCEGCADTVWGRYHNLLAAKVRTRLKDGEDQLDRSCEK